MHRFCALTEESLSFYNREPKQVLMGTQETNADIAQLNSSVQQKQRGHLDVSLQNNAVSWLTDSLPALTFG